MGSEDQEKNHCFSEQVNGDYHGPKPKGKDRITKEVSSTFGRADSYTCTLRTRHTEQKNFPAMLNCQDVTQIQKRSENNAQNTQINLLIWFAKLNKSNFE